MKTPDDVSEMLRLKACGWGLKRIARQLGCSHHTVRGYVAAGGVKPFKAPGTGALTVLGQTLSETRSAPKVRLGAIRRTELSPSRFWIDALRRAGKRRAIPKELLLCVIRSGDGDDDPAKEPAAFRAEGWIDRGLEAMSMASIVDKAFERVVVMSDLPFDPPAPLQAAGTSQVRLSLSEARWLAQFVPSGRPC